MGYEIVRGPFLLLETVAMMYKFVNGISFRTVLNRQRFLATSAVTEGMARRLECLQDIMEEVCRELNPREPVYLHYFRQVEEGGEDVCLAQLMTYSFCTMKYPGFRENTEEIRAIWRGLCSCGARIDPEASSITLSFQEGKGEAEDLFDQVCALNYPAEFRISLYRAMRDFDRSLDELAALLEPLARKLEAAYRRESWLFEEAAGYWNDYFQSREPLDFLREKLGNQLVRNPADQSRIWIMLMNSNILACGMPSRLPGGTEWNLVLIGSAVAPQSGLRREGTDIQTVSAILKCIADKKRMEILQRLSVERSYCHELAEVMGMHPGNMSRTLNQLHSYGFLRMEREATINYYRTDPEAVHNFLELVETVIVK